MHRPAASVVVLGCAAVACGGASIVEDVATSEAPAAHAYVEASAAVARDEPGALGAGPDEPARPARDEPAGSGSAHAPDAPPRASDRAEPHWSSLAVEGYADAVVVEPPGDGHARPLIVATHGAGGRPEVHCARWLEIVGDRAFIACTRGRSTSTHLPEEERGFFYDGHHELGRELDATLVALERRYGPRLDAKGAIFAGYSQGATMGILALHEKPERAARFGGIVLVEGGTGDWNVALSDRMVRLGVRRVAFVCGQDSCADAAMRSKPWLARAGLPLRIEHARGAGHTYRGEVGPLVEQAFAWVVDGDARFASR